jgi:hypothetical protein
VDGRDHGSSREDLQTIVHSITFSLELLSGWEGVFTYHNLHAQLVCLFDGEVGSLATGDQIEQNLRGISGCLAEGHYLSAGGTYRRGSQLLHGPAYAFFALDSFEKCDVGAFLDGRLQPSDGLDEAKPFPQRRMCQDPGYCSREKYGHYFCAASVRAMMTKSLPPGMAARANEAARIRARNSGSLRGSKVSFGTQNRRCVV